MREILFRGKSFDDGKWYEGRYIWEVFRHVGNSDIRLISIDAGKSGVIHVFPETVGQWTGLHDKNNTKIFEGDIMNSPGNVVEFCGGGFCINGDSPLSYWTMTEIIGNIHDK